MATRRPCGVCGNTYAENKDGALRKHKCVDALIDVPAVPAAAPDAAAEDAPRWAALLRALPERRSQMAEAAAAAAAVEGALAARAALSAARADARARHGINLGVLGIEEVDRRLQALGGPPLAPGFGMLNAKLERLADAALAAERAEQPPPPPAAKRARPAAAAGEEAWLAAVATLGAESPTYPRRRETFGAYGSSLVPATRRARVVGTGVAGAKTAFHASLAVAGANPAFYDSLEAALEAADHGDVVLLGPGDWTLVARRDPKSATRGRGHAVALRKSVEILGAGRPRVSVVAEAPFHVLEAPLVVSQAHVRFADLDLVFPPPTSSCRPKGASGRLSADRALVEFDGCRLVARGEGFDDIVPQPLLAVQRGAGAVLRRTVVYCGPRTASAAVHVAHADAGPVFLANADLRCDAGLTDALGVGVLVCLRAISSSWSYAARGAPRASAGRAAARGAPLDRAALEDCPKVVGVATSLIRGADRGVHADREAPAAFRRDVALEGGTVVLACSPSVKHAALAAAAYAKKSKQPKRPWDFGKYDLTRLLVIGHAGTSVFRRVPKDVLALVASYVAADRILDMVPNLRTQAKRRYEATKRTLDSARNAAARAAALVEAARAPGRVLDDAERCRSLLVQVPGAADELANDVELRKRYGGLRAGVQHRDATDYGIDDDVAADDYAVTVPAPPSYARRCADHGKRFARSSSAAMTLGVCTQGADPNDSHVALCVAGRLRKAVTLVYNPRGEHFEPRVKFGIGLARRDQAAGFWSGGPCPTCRRATSVVVDEAQVSAAIWACLPQRFRDWAERDRLCLSLCDRGHLSGQLLPGGYAGCECCGGYGDMDY